MVNNPSQTDLPALRAPRVVLAAAGTSLNESGRTLTALSAGPGGEASHPRTPVRSSATTDCNREGAVMSIQAILYDKGSNVVTVTPGASIKSAAEKLLDKNIAALVVQAGGAVLGLISEREIVHALAGSGERTCGLPVSQVMTRDIVTVSPEDSLKRAMALMTRHRTRHLLVLKDGEPAGIVSIGDVIKHRLDDLELKTIVRRDVYATAH